MVDFNPPDPTPPEEEPSPEEFETMAAEQADRIDDAGQYVAEYNIFDDAARERAENARQFDTEAITIEERDDGEFLVFRQADAKEFVYGSEILAERVVGV